MTRRIEDDEPTLVLALAPRAPSNATTGAPIRDVAELTTAELPAPESIPFVATSRLPDMTLAVPGREEHSDSGSVPSRVPAGRLDAAMDTNEIARFRALTDAVADLPTTILPRFTRASLQKTRRGLGRRMSYPVLAVVLLLSLIVGFAGTQSVLQVLDAKTAVSDAKAQVALIEGVLKGGDLLQTERLTEISTHIQMLERDLTRIQADVPFEPLLSSNATVAGALHLLAMAQDLARAGERGIAAALILIPSVKGILHGLGSSGSPAQSAPGTLTAAQVNTATGDVNTATSLLHEALAERKQVRDGDLQTLGLASMVPLLHKLDAETPKLNTYLGQAHTLMAALPALLGIGTPINYLLFNMDSDELRPTGGFLGNYALLTLSGGKLASGVHLHDVMEMDCPNSSCFPRALPQQFAWFPFAQVAGTQIFDVRDSNLDPDFPASAALAEQFAQEEGTPGLGGVIAITPGLIEQVLRVTGPIRVDPLGVTVTAANLQDEIHYYHILNAYCVGYASDPRCAQLDNPALQQYQTTGRKVFDAVLGSTLLHTLGTLPQQRQSALLRVLLNALQTKDLQVYVNDPRVEGLLASFHVDGAVQAPQNEDNLFVVDANIGATYVNGDVKERVRDTITLDAQGAATHDLTITYDYPIVPHIWNDIYPAAGGSFRYRDVVRVIVPPQAQLDVLDGCYSPGADAPEPGHAVFACEFMLYRTGSLTIHVLWTVSHAATTANGMGQYALLLQKQAGTNVALSVTIQLPPHAHVSGAPQAPLTSDKSGSTVQYAGNLDKNVALVVAYQ